MDKSAQHIIKTIAQELDSGCNCYYNPQTHETVAIPNFSQFFDDDDLKDAFSDSLERVKNHKADFIKIEILEGHESFKIMEFFVDQLPDENLKAVLENVLANKKPFQNFKHKVDHSDFRQDWFDFKQNELEKIVEKRLNSK